MPTIQCLRCSHIFMSYASECPECGCKRPRDSYRKWGPRIALLISALALTATMMIVKWVIQQDEEPSLPVRTKAQSPAPTTANMTAQATAKQR